MILFDKFIAFVFGVPRKDEPPIATDAKHTVYKDEEQEVARMEDEGGPASNGDRAE